MPSSPAKKGSSMSTPSGPSSQKKKKTPYAKKPKQGGTVQRPSLKQLKNELRGTERLLTKIQQTCQATEQTRLERKISALKYQIEQTKLHQQDEKLIEKYDTMYRAVKFFERQKSVRLIKKLKKQESESQPDGIEEKTSEPLKQAYLHLCYVMQYPPATKYLSLYPSTPLSPEAAAQQQEILQKIQTLIDNQVLDPEETYQQCLNASGSKKKTKRTGPTVEELKRKEIGELLRGVRSNPVDEVEAAPVSKMDDEFFLD